MKPIKIKAFTVAEVMITLTVIGIITAIILPVALHSKPDENIMKFKKGHATLYRVIGELVNSDKYYCNGDLGMKPDCTTLIRNVMTETYFCNTFAELVSYNEKKCATNVYDDKSFIYLSADSKIMPLQNLTNCRKTTKNVTEASINTSKSNIDAACVDHPSANSKKAEIVTTDGIIYYNFNAAGLGEYVNYNSHSCKKDNDTRYFSPPGQNPANIADQFGNDIAYAVICMDIDEFKKGEPPFGYGIRADGKLINGARADAWLNKNIQGD